MSLIYDEDWDSGREEYVSSRKCGKPLGPDAPHYPNSSERRELIKIMKKSGMSEAEVRDVKSNRQALAKARKAPTSRGSTDRWRLKAKRIARGIALNSGVPIWVAQRRVGL